MSALRPILAALVSLLPFATALSPTPHARAAEFFVAPDGTAAAAGSREAPWSVAHAFANPPAVKPGDVIWLRGGTYPGNVVCRLAGTKEQPIVVRQTRGERATFDCRSLDGKPTMFAVVGHDVRLQDFEVTNSDPRRETKQSGSWPTDLYRGSVDCRGDRISLVNLVIHELATGVAMWSEGEAGEVYGCLIYNNGWRAPDRGHGHGIYTQNIRGTKVIADNFIFNQFGYGIHAYGSSKAKLEGYDIEGNTLFNNGILVADGSRSSNLLVGGGAKAARISITDNFAYHTGLEQTCLQIGYGPQSDDLVLSNNVIAGFMRIMSWQKGTVEYNRFVGKSSMIELNLADFKELAGFQWDKNQYLSGEQRFAPFAAITPAERTVGKWDDWRTRTGFDAKSTYVKGPPTGRYTTARANKYEPGRVQIVVFNWDKDATAQVYLHGPKLDDKGRHLLKPGTKYRIVSATNFYGEPIVSGTYDDRTITLPLTPTKAPPPIGFTAPTPPTEPEFGAYILLPE